MININSISFRLIIWYSGLITVVSLSFGAAIYRDVEARLYNNVEGTLSRRAHQLADDVLPKWGIDDRARLGGAISAVYSPEATSRFIRISDAADGIIYVSQAPEDHSFSPANVPRAKAPLPTAGDVRFEALPSGLRMQIFSLPTKVSGHDLIIEMGSPTMDSETVLGNLLISLGIGLPLVALVVSAGGWVLVRRSLRPVEQLRATAQEITFGNLEHRLPVARTGDAIEDLAVTLNQMLERLSEAYTQASRFSADASHELRTPLAIIRAELESLVERAGPLPLEVKERLGSVLEETERMSRITESLFRLSRLEAGEAKTQEVHLDLAFLVRNTVDQIRLLAEEKTITMTVEAEAPVFVRGDPARLKQAVVDLLDNALKYTPSDGRITLKVFQEGDQATLEVADTGIGIPAEALPHVFERFYRADKARSRQIEGAGLGLAIVRSICQAHGGSVEIESVEGAGTTCHVHLPAAA